MYCLLDAELRHHAGALRGLACALVGDDHADDLMQDATVQALQEGQRPAALRAWLQQVLRHLAGKHHRAAARRRRHEQRAESAPLLQSPDLIAEHRETLRRLDAALLALPEPYQGTLLLRYFEDLTPTAISAKTGVPLATIKSRLQRGLQLLRKRLDADGSGDWRAAFLGVFGLERALPVGAAVLTGVLVMGTGVKLALGSIAAAVAVAATLFLANGSPPAASAPAGVQRGETAQPAQAGADTVGEPPQASGELARTEVTAAPAPTTDAPRLTIRVTRSDTGAPVPSLVLWILRVDGRPPNNMYVTTNDDGLAEVDPIAPGEVHVVLGSARIQIAPSGTTHHDLVLDPFYAVHGVVVDVDGQPIAGASVWRTDSNLSARGATLMTTTSVDGRFEWTSWSVFENLYATAPGFSASPVFDLGGTPEDQPPELRIALWPSAGAVTGVVVDELDRPITGAAITLRGQAPEPVDPEAERSFFKSNPRWAPQWIAHTDELGKFRFGDLAAGTASLSVRATGHGQARQKLNVTAGTDTAVRVVLGAPLLVKGFVTDDRGHAVQGARVATGSPGSFGAAIAHSGVDGSYLLTDVTPGYARLQVWREGYEVVQEILKGKASETLRFDPVLRRKSVVRGILLDDAGDPLAGWSVSRAAGGGGWPETAPDGRFEYPGDNADPPELMGAAPLDVRPRRHDFPRLLRRDPERRGEQWVYRPVPGGEPTARIAGRLLLSDGASDAPIYLRVNASHPRWGHSYRLEVSEEAFAVGPLPPGEVSLIVDGDALPRVDLGMHVLRPHQTLDLGAITVRAPVPLRIEVRQEDGRSVDWLRVELHDAEGQRWQAGYSGGVLEVEPLPAGRYELSVYAPALQWQRVAFELVPGEAKELRVELAGGTTVRFRASVVDPAVSPGEVRIEVRDEAGKVTAQLSPGWHLLSKSSEGCGMGPGRYRAHAVAAGGLTATTRFTVPGDGSGPVEVVLELR